MFERLTLISKFNYSYFLMSKFYSEIQRKSEIIIIFGSWIKINVQFLKIKFNVDNHILVNHVFLSIVWYTQMIRSLKLLHIILGHPFQQCQILMLLISKKQLYKMDIISKVLLLPIINFFVDSLFDR